MNSAIPEPATLRNKFRSAKHSEGALTEYCDTTARKKHTDLTSDTAHKFRNRATRPCPETAE